MYRNPDGSAHSPKTCAGRKLMVLLQGPEVARAVLKPDQRKLDRLVARKAA